MPYSAATHNAFADCLLIGVSGLLVFELCYWTCDDESPIFTIFAGKHPTINYTDYSHAAIMA